MCFDKSMWIELCRHHSTTLFYPTTLLPPPALVLREHHLHLLLQVDSDSESESPKSSILSTLYDHLWVFASVLLPKQPGTQRAGFSEILNKGATKCTVGRNRPSYILKIDRGTGKIWGLVPIYSVPIPRWHREYGLVITSLSLYIYIYVYTYILPMRCPHLRVH